MIRELSIRQFAIIEEVQLRFEDGFHVLTGETGAGKSILLDALGMIVGGRASVDYVRHGAKKAEIEALFELSPSHSIWQLLDEWGIEDEENFLSVRREIAANGKSICRINGRVVTLTQLRKMGWRLVGIHGQHEHQALLKTEEHLEWLDQFAGEGLLTLREQYTKNYRSYQRIAKEIDSLTQDQQQLTRRIEMLSYQQEEIEQAQLKTGEEEALDQEHRVLTHGEKLSEQVQRAYEMLYGENQGMDSVEKSNHYLQEAANIDPSLQPVQEMVQTATAHLEEALRQLATYREWMEFDPNRLAVVQERLFLIQSLKRKYGATVEDILQYQQSIQQELHSLERYDERLEELEEEQSRIEEELGNLAVQLSTMRKKAASQLESLIEKELAELQMKATVFHVSFYRNRQLPFTITGKDQIEFQIAPNYGEPLRPLAKIASGGELSRIMLALLSIFSHLENTNTLVFDEIDTGVSGRAAQAIAEKIAALARKHQVLCVTHLPQVACMADHHFLISKQMTQQVTRTQVQPLYGDEKVDELARMLSGVEVTNTTQEHALEMLRLANQVKQAYNQDED